ncbi:MAG: GNAT family N-acetyltransferase, partial [Alphaproteobacteria bacterium]
MTNKSKPRTAKTAPKRRSPLRNKASLIVRNATLDDVKAIYDLGIKVYGRQGAMTQQMIRGQITKFPDGQFVVEYEGEIAGYCATFMIKGDVALQPHTWKEITGNGFASRHDPMGDYLYGMEVLVDSERRGLRIATRLYQKRTELCEDLELKGIIFGGRIPGYGKKHKSVSSPTEYIENVRARKFRDPVVLFHLSQDYEFLGVLKNYDPDDKESRGWAAHLIWRNPALAEPVTKDKSPHTLQSGAVRVATVQFQMRRVESEEQFEHQLEYFVDVASDYGSDFVAFPEMVTLALLSATNKKMRPEEAIDHLTDYTKRYLEVMKNMAISYNINIIGGSHPTKMEDGDIHNVCYVFLRSGEVYAQEKLHPTPDERYWWNIKGGDVLEAIPTD